MGVRDRIASSITDIQNRGKRLVELNVELLTAEIKRRGQQYGAAAALFGAAGLLALYGLGFALATIAVVLYIWLPLWLSLLIVTVALFLIVLILALIGRSRLRAAQQPPTAKPADEARKSIDFAKGQLRQTAQSVVPKRSSVTLAPRTGTTSGPSWSPSPPPGSSQPVSRASSGTTRPDPATTPSRTGSTSAPPSPPAGESAPPASPPGTPPPSAGGR